MIVCDLGPIIDTSMKFVFLGAEWFLRYKVVFSTNQSGPNYHFQLIQACPFPEAQVKYSTVWVWVGGIPVPL